MRLRPKKLPTLALPACLLATLVIGCTNKDLGNETYGSTIGQAKGSRVVRVDPEDRKLRPRFAGETLDGAPIGSADLDGSVAVVNFWASWCPPCRNEQKGLERVWRTYKTRGVKFLGIDLRDNKVDAQAYIDEFDVTYPSIFNKDSSIAARFRLLVPPSTFVLDRQGRVAGHIIGIVADDRHLSELIDSVLGVEPMIASIESAVTGPAGLLVAFGVGIVSFFSPCVLPLVPGYLTFMSGVGGQDLEAGVQRGRVVAASLLFVAGFAIVFTLLGAGASLLGGVLLDNIVGFRRFAGVIVIVMGLIFLSTLAVKPLLRWRESGNGLVRGASGAGLKVATLLSTEHRMSTSRLNAGVVGALPLGAAFAIGWTPCVGPGLGVILSLAAQEGSAGKGAFLLLFFSMGFGLWFVLGGLAFGKAMRAFGLIRRHMRGFVAVGGLLMITIGILMVTDTWNEVLAPLRRWINNFSPPI